MGKTKKKTKPIIPGKSEIAKTLWIIRWIQHSNIWKAKKTKGRHRFATLWEAAAEFVDTKDFEKLVHTYYKKKSQTYIDNLLNNRDVYGNPFKNNKKQRKIKFVLNMFREVKNDLPKKMFPFELPKPTAFDKMIMKRLYQGIGSLIKPGSNKLLVKNTYYYKSKSK